MRKILLFLLLLSCTNIFAVTRTAVTTGNWFTAATWGGTVPVAADVAVIPTGITVTLNLTGTGLNTPWNNPGAIKVSGKLILNGNDPFFSNPCALEVFSGGELNDKTYNNQYLLTQVSYVKVYAGGKTTSSPIESIIFNGNNQSAEYDFPNTTMNGPFTITVSGGQVTYVGTALPLKLTGFTVQQSGADNRLNWQTTNEVNTADFFIERSSDGINYKSIGNVAATGSVINNNYSFTDRAVLNGNSFYRLKMTDIDGGFTYSDIVRINRNASQRISVYLSPAKDIIHITTGTKGKVVIYNTAGKLVRSQQIPAGKSTVDVSTLSDGIYFIEQAGQRTSFIK